jgi:hypothetical protein
MHTFGAFLDPAIQKDLKKAAQQRPRESTSHSATPKWTLSLTGSGPLHATPGSYAGTLPYVEADGGVCIVDGYVVGVRKVLALEIGKEMRQAFPKPWQIYIVYGVAFQTVSTITNIL